MDKIIYRQVQFDPHMLPEIPESFAGDYWYVEIAQRQAIMKALKGAKDYDVVIVTDADEIVSRETSIKLRGLPAKVQLGMQMHYYHLNCLVEGEWVLPFAIPYGMLARNYHHFIRQEFDPKNPVWHNAGWHFSFFGSNDYLRKKLSSYPERRFDNPEFTSDENLNLVRSTGQDFAHRPEAKMKIVENIPFLPNTIKADPEKYKALGWFQ
jgi:hypothetical protein